MKVANKLVMSALAKQIPSYVALLAGVRMLIDVRVDACNNSRAVYRTLSELIALDVLANDLVMALLTNLTDYWEFFWVSDKDDGCISIQHVVFARPGEAFAMIKATLTQSPMAHEINIPWLGEPVKRHKLAALLPSIRDNTAVLEAFEQYHAISSVFGPDEDLARALGRQIARSIPVFSMCT